MLVVAISNYDKESFNEYVMCTTDSERKAKLIAESLNKAIDPDGEVCYRVKPDDYKLYKFQP